jgi:hypothetical protein
MELLTDIELEDEFLKRTKIKFVPAVEEMLLSDAYLVLKKLYGCKMCGDIDL